MTAHDANDELFQTKLNLETGQIPWKELQRHFAAGKVLAVGPSLDLVEVAAQISADDTASVQAWLAHGALAKVADAQALHWYETDALLWAVVVRPWILVQDKGGPTG
jgi:hypothetical protein